MRRSAAAKVYIALTAIVTVFQLALVAGAPWGEFTMGGAFPGQLPPRMRVVAAASAVLLSAFGAAVAARANLALLRGDAARRLMWVVVAYAFLGVVVNAITPSAGERPIWLPVTLVLAGCAIIVARSSEDATVPQTATNRDDRRFVRL